MSNLNHLTRSSKRESSLRRSNDLSSNGITKTLLEKYQVGAIKDINRSSKANVQNRFS